MVRQRRNRSYRPRPSSRTRFWYIGKRNKNTEIIYLLILAMLVGGGAWQSISRSSQVLLVTLLVIMVALLFAAVFGFVAFISYRQKQKRRALSFSQVDHMDGHEFERYVGALLERQGFSHVRVTQGSGDYGVDVIAVKDGQKWAVQAKRYNGHVAQEAIREAVAGCHYYQCQRSMVVATSYFTQHAKELARANNTILIDRDKLAEWIIAFQHPSISR